LDLDRAGPSFGSRALAALLAEGAPLHGLDVKFSHDRYDWTDSTRLGSVLGAEPGTAVFAGSSEGGLFEYGSDEDIISNLEAVWDCTPEDAVFVGSVTRADGRAGTLNAFSKIATRLRTPEAFNVLVRRAGWILSRAIEGPLSHNISLRKA
jgi:hypothetical protein